MSDPVPLTIVPNAPLGEALCGKLEEAGIPAYYRDVGSAFTNVWGGSAVNPASPVEIMVNPEDLEPAKQVIA
jgi:hypothetical protein